ncbi:hypothetical protein NDU88_005828 [Pleurodeles waltl]|uniref:Uncharacterized protein n=1 Tax=Pleurodeles waltl TaxID=8319 RepID=A0AAV7TBS4_PLEWA|nr:hypothetical protein NDU88_005828 [Pleurodeles waltl]
MCRKNTRRRETRRRKDAKSEEDVEKGEKDAGIEGGSVRGSGEAERVKETRPQAGEEQTPGGTETTRHVLGGTWLMQVRACILNPTTYFGRGKGKEGKEE